jgi:hypothetical protein
VKHDYLPQTLAFTLIVFVLFGKPCLLAQSVIPDVVISTDRPSVANSSFVVPRGYFQAEDGWRVTNANGQSVVDLPETNLRFGWLDKNEFRFEVPDYFQSLNGTSVSGFGDLAIGVKHQLGPIPENFNLAVIAFVSFPTGAKNISSHGYDPGLQLPWALPLSKNWTTSGQTAFYWPTAGATRNFTGETTFVLDRQLSKPWDTFVEYAGDFSEKTGSRQILHIGSSYKLTPRQQVDFQFAAGLSHAAPHVFFGVGYSFLLHIFK